LELRSRVFIDPGQPRLRAPCQIVINLQVIEDVITKEIPRSGGVVGQRVGVFWDQARAMALLAPSRLASMSIASACAAASVGAVSPPITQPFWSSMIVTKVRLAPFGVVIHAHLKAAAVADDGMRMVGYFPGSRSFRNPLVEDQQIAVTFGRCAAFSVAWAHSFGLFYSAACPSYA
jgi:hypothetical protein